MTGYCRTCGHERTHWAGCTDTERVYPVTHLAGRLAVHSEAPSVREHRQGLLGQKPEKEVPHA